ncbi:hypothetical protein GCM10027592_47130 [Spirosoma flavus]
MKIKSNLAWLLIAVLPMLAGCTKEETVYKDLPKAVYITNKVADGTANITNSASAKKNVTTGAARVYLNQPYEKDVTVNFTLGGTATAGQDYTPPTTQSVTIVAGRYSGEINFAVLNNPAQTTNKTVLINLVSATEGFDIGIGFPKGYSTFTYTITP